MSSPASPGADTRPLVVVTTDPELDDLNSMLRLLLYSNEIRLAGLVYSSSVFHAEGDLQLGIAPLRWPPPEYQGHIHEAIDAYARVWDNLRVHDPRYPSADMLRAMVAVGNVRTVGDMDEPTDGSRLIEQVLNDPGSDRVFLQAWGGLNTIARALKSIEERARESGTWDAVYSDLSSRVVITSFGLQDDTFEAYIRPHWPQLEHREVATLVWGYFAWEVVPDADRRYLEPPWTRAHVSSQGPMGATYRVWGDGRQMAAGFDEADYFGIPDADPSVLEAGGYRLWCPLREPGSWISEGDSSNFALLCDNGLRSWEDATYGGWGGRQVRNPEDPHQWTSALAEDVLPHGMEAVRMPDGRVINDYHAARWFGAVQRDFAARLRWSVTPARAEANHHPTVRVDAETSVDAEPGRKLRIPLIAADPDGDRVALRAWHYREAGTCPERAAVGMDQTVVEVQVPSSAGDGETLHIIVECEDDGDPPLVAYARIVIRVRSSGRVPSG